MAIRLSGAQITRIRAEIDRCQASDIHLRKVFVEDLVDQVFKICIDEVEIHKYPLFKINRDTGEITKL